jgi:hypothetical protein
LPAVIKPVRSEGEAAGGFVRLDAHAVNDCSQLQLLRPILAGHQWLVQPQLSGQLGAVCGIAWHGAVICATHQRSERIWPLEVGATAYGHTVRRDSTLERGVAALVGEFAWTGFFQAQFLHTADTAYLIDFNPRVYGSLSLAIAAGANLPAMWAALVRGEPVAPIDYRVGVRYRSEIRDMCALGHMIRSGHVAQACRGLLPRRGTIHEVGSLRDPLPLLTAGGWFLRHVSKSAA